MKNAILSVVLILISYLIANVMPTDGFIGGWSVVACFVTGVIVGFAVGILAWAEWN
jgi:predicted flavoprotein YhiN